MRRVVLPQKPVEQYTFDEVLRWMWRRHAETALGAL
jgi:hypothetical protein